MLPLACYASAAMRLLPIRCPAVCLLAVWLRGMSGLAQVPAQFEPVLGPAPGAPLDVSGLPGMGPRPLDATVAFNVNGNSREQVREFYNAIYPASEGVPMNSSAITASCDAGTNSAAFLTAELWRINWFRAMSGIPADVTFSTSEDAEDQSAALMMSANNQLMHVGIPPAWSCFSDSGTNAAANSNLALGADGPDAITRLHLGLRGRQRSGGASPLAPLSANPGHGQRGRAGARGRRRGECHLDTRRQLRRASSGDHRALRRLAASWIRALSGRFSAMVLRLVQRGPEHSLGHHAKQRSFPQRGCPTLRKRDPARIPSYGIPATLIRPATAPFFHSTAPILSMPSPSTMRRRLPGRRASATPSPLFDPALRGADFVPTVISGTNRPSVNENNPFCCTPSANPNTTGYQWVASQSTNGNLADNALKGLTNFTISPSPVYPVITNPPVGSGKCFHLTHTNAVPQLLQFTEVLFPATNTSLSFQSFLGYATGQRSGARADFHQWRRRLGGPVCATGNQRSPRGLHRPHPVALQLRRHHHAGALQL